MGRREASRRLTLAQSIRCQKSVFQAQDRVLHGNFWCGMLKDDPAADRIRCWEETDENLTFLGARDWVHVCAEYRWRNRICGRRIGDSQRRSNWRSARSLFRMVWKDLKRLKRSNFSKQKSGKRKEFFSARICWSSCARERKTGKIDQVYLTDRCGNPRAIVLWRITMGKVSTLQWVSTASTNESIEFRFFHYSMFIPTTLKS